MQTLSFQKSKACRIFSCGKPFLYHKKLLKTDLAVLHYSNTSKA